MPAQGMLPPQVQDHERIRAQLNAALTAMNMAMEGQRLPPVYAAPAPQPAAPPVQPPLPPEDPLAGSRWASGELLTSRRRSVCSNACLAYAAPARQPAPPRVQLPLPPPDRWLAGL